jgi:predicted phage baseplate assembly protein
MADVPADPPTVDGRSSDELTARARDLATAYASGEWTPGSADAGDALVALFGEMAGEIVERLDRVPEKHRVAFYDRLGFDRQPPTAARLPLLVTVADGVDTVSVPEGTAALATGSDGSERTFETVPGSAFEATSATLDRVYAVDPATDRVVDHRAVVDGGEPVTLFEGTDEQRHALYLGDDDLLAVAPDGTLRVTVTGSTPQHVVEYGVRWEYHGTDGGGDGGGGADDRGEEGWHRLEVNPLDVDPIAPPGETATVDLGVPGELSPTTVGGRESLWIRARVPDGLGPLGLFDLRVSAVSVGPGPTERPPDLLLANDVPLAGVDTTGEYDGGETDERAEVDLPVLPFGETPQRMDAFYVADGEALTKPGALVELVFSRPDGTRATPVSAPRLSWEYWDGDRWARLDVDDGTTALTGEGTVAFTVPTDLAATSVAGETAHWVRARLVGGSYVRIEYEVTEDVPPEVTETPTGQPPAFASVLIRYADGLPGGTPTHRLCENTLSVADVGPRLDAEESVRPFRPTGDSGGTLYLGFDRPLSDGPITLFVETADRAIPDGFHPGIRWEYSDDTSGETWRRLRTEDGTGGLLRSGIVSLVFGTATVAHERFGVERHWIRARVSGDQFLPDGDCPADPTAVPVRVVDIDAPSERVVLENAGSRPVDLTGYRLDFEYGQPAEQTRTLPPDTRLDAGGRLVVETGAEPPGDPPADVRFTYRAPVLNDVDPDTVALLTPSGDLVTSRRDRTPSGTASSVLRSGHSTPGAHVRLADRRPTDVDPPTDVGADAVDAAAAGPGPVDPEPCDPTLPTEPPSGDPTRAPPTVLGLYRNAAWAADLVRVTDERVGSSTGVAGQRFTLGSVPVLDATVTVDEHGSLSEAAREALLAERPEEVSVETGPDGSVRAVRVEWTRVADLLASGPGDRHYVLDGVAGELRFGDGTRGRIPPRSRDGIRASYTSGGGEAGNVTVGAVEGLRSSLPFVDGVTNPVAGDGGSEAESTARVLERAPRELRDRGRAVTAADVERVASGASRRLGRVRCLPGMDASGEARPGWVTLLLVPEGIEPKPLPSATLREAVGEAVREALPATLVATNRLVVRGPSYVTVSVETRVAGDGSRTVSRLEADVTAALDAFLHPLTGGPGDEGWVFGALPAPGDLFARLEDVEGVDHVAGLAVRYEGAGGSVTVREGDAPPRVSSDVLVTGGSHDVDATATGGPR